MAEQRRQAGREGRGGDQVAVITHTHKHPEIHTYGDEHTETHRNICMGMYAYKHANETTSQHTSYTVVRGTHSKNRLYMYSQKHTKCLHTPHSLTHTQTAF